MAIRVSLVLVLALSAALSSCVLEEERIEEIGLEQSELFTEVPDLEGLPGYYMRVPSIAPRGELKSMWLVGNAHEGEYTRTISDLCFRPGCDVETGWYWAVPNRNSPAATARDRIRITIRALLHDIQAAGLTATELKEVIKKDLKPYMEAPEVTVIVQQINSWRIYVQGEVQKPGVYPIRSRTTLSQVISMVGGFTEFAKEGKIQVVRDSGGEREIIPINYKLIMDGEAPSLDIYLRPGDTIIVP